MGLDKTHLSPRRPTIQSSTQSGYRLELLSEADRHLRALPWEALADTLGVDLDATARAWGALRRRREVKRAGDLLRLILLYAVCDWSLQSVGLWFGLARLGALSDTAVLKRLRHSRAWLGRLIVILLQRRRLQWEAQPGVRLRLRDATVISQPGSQGTNWRVHLSLDLGSGCLSGVEVTDAQGGETLARFPAQGGEIVVADRGYGFARSLDSVLATAGHLVVRISAQNLPLTAVTSRRWQLRSWLRQVRRPCQRAVWLATPHACFRLRLIAWPLPPAAAAQARRRVRRAAWKKGRTPNRSTLQEASVVLLLTNLPAAQWSERQVVELYRVRWQIELTIKRWKSLLHLDGLRAKEPELVQTYLLGKLLAALLVEDAVQATAARCPTWFASLTQPLSLWRLTHFWWEQLRQELPGHLPLAWIWACLPQLRRYLCSPPRRRLQQWAVARARYSLLFTC